MIFSGCSNWFCGPGWSHSSHGCGGSIGYCRSRGFGGSYESDWLGGSGGPSVHIIVLFKIGSSNKAH